jgi:hypothetical protein
MLRSLALPDFLHMIAKGCYALDHNFALVAMRHSKKAFMVRHAGLWAFLW